MRDRYPGGYIREDPFLNHKLLKEGNRSISSQLWEASSEEGSLITEGSILTLRVNDLIGIANICIVRMPNGHLRVDPKTQLFICRPDDRPTVAEVNRTGRSGMF